MNHTMTKLILTALLAIATVTGATFTGATIASGAESVPLNQRQARTSPEWLTGGVMYQIQPRAFTPEGTLPAATARLPKVAELGVDIVYICPVFVSDDDPDRGGWSPRQKASKMNNPRNPYRMKDYYHVDPEYGTDDDLKEFVATAHKLGMRVMLDMVYLHCGPNAVFLKEHPNFVQRDEKGNIVCAKWNFPKINHANPELREYLWRNMEYWVREFGVDGFRCDVSDRIPLDFWETARERLEKIRPDIGMLAEGTRPADQLKAFDLDYGWGFNWDDAAAFRKQWEKIDAARPRGGAKFIRFIDNHDISNDDYDNRLEKQWGSRRVDAALVTLFTLDGVPFLYNGQEVADTARHSIFGKSPIDWANGKTPVGVSRLAFCKILCTLRHAETALTKGKVIWLDNDEPGAVLSFLRQTDAEEILTVVNLTGREVRVRVALSWESADKFVTLLSERVEQEHAQDGRAEFLLKGNAYFVGGRVRPGERRVKHRVRRY